MPLQNMGTLLENIVLLSAARVAFDRLPSGSPLEFVSSFAMPPLSKWHGGGSARLISAAVLDAVMRDELAPSDTSYRALLASIMRAHGGQGPSGALLVTRLAHLQEKLLRAWLNDDASATVYQGTNAALQGFGSLAALNTNAGGAVADFTVEPTSYPDSVNFLAKWLSKESSKIRLGYLDPNNYTTGKRKAAETSSHDHRCWLRMLRTNAPALVISVHFTACRHAMSRLRSLQQMAGDAASTGYVLGNLSNGNYLTTVSVHAASGEAEATAVTERIVAGAIDELAAWSRSFGLEVPALR